MSTGDLILTGLLVGFCSEYCFVFGEQCKLDEGNQKTLDSLYNQHGGNVVFNLSRQVGFLLGHRLLK